MPSSSLAPDTLPPTDAAASDSEFETAISADDPTGANGVSDPSLSNNDKGESTKKLARGFLPRGPPRKPVRGPGPDSTKPAPAPPTPATQQPQPTPAPQPK